MKNLILTEEEIAMISDAVTKKSENYINVNSHIFRTIVVHVIKDSLKTIVSGRKNE